MTFSSTLSLPLTTLAELFGRAFEGYLVPISSEPELFAARVRQEQIDLAASLVVRAPDGELAGFALIARRGDTSRLAGMGITPPWRGKRIGEKLVARVLEEARVRADRQIVLEVIEQNLPAVRLYEKSGFLPRRRLVGYEASHLDPQCVDLEETSVAEYAAQVARHGDADLPWQLTAATAGAATLPTVAFRFEAAMALLNVTAGATTVRGIVVHPSHRRQGQASQLLRGLAARFPGRRWVVPAVVPEGLAAGFFLAHGFQHAAVSQFEMVHPLHDRR